jgi:hypothetical protein
MGDGLVGAMVAALRRANRKWADDSRAARRQPAPRKGGASAWGYLAHPALMPTVFSPSAADGDVGEDVAARKV